MPKLKKDSTLFELDVFGNVLWSRMQHCITTKAESDEKVTEYIIWEFYILNLQTRAAWIAKA